MDEDRTSLILVWEEFLSRWQTPPGEFVRSNEARSRLYTQADPWSLRVEP